MARKAGESRTFAPDTLLRRPGRDALSAGPPALARLVDLPERWEWLGYLAALVFAELTVSLVDARLGLALHVLLMLTLLVRAGFTPPARRTLVLALVLAPVIRIVSLTLPLNGVPAVGWYLLTSIPLFAVCAWWIRSLQLSRTELGLGMPTDIRCQLLIGFLGYPLGAIEFLILHPAPIASTAGPGNIVLAGAILLLCTGFLEELIFRGIVQAAVLRLFGRRGLVYASAIFASLHIGYLSFTDVVFVFGVGLLFSWLVAKTGSLLGVSIAHGMTNILLLLVLPVLPIASQLSGL